MEILLAVVGNLKVVIVIGLVASCVALACAVFAWGLFAGEPQWKDWTAKSDAARSIALKTLFRAVVPLSILACIPSLDDVWRVRVALIKYQLASPENVQRGVETIERIGHKLECKYLGGCEEPKVEKDP